MEFNQIKAQNLNKFFMRRSILDFAQIPPIENVPNFRKGESVENYPDENDLTCLTYFLAQTAHTILRRGARPSENY